MSRGGVLYDKFWKADGVTATEPADSHPLYPSFGAKSGSDTWRCKECHGWDYIGRDGRYASGSHYTGIPGLYPATQSLWRAFMIIRDDHGYGTAGLADADIWDLVKFYREGMLDISTVLGKDGSFTGNATAGAALFSGGLSGFDASGKKTQAACSTCHDADGTKEVVAGFTAFPGFLANDNPQEFLHKVRFGHPGSTPAMPASAAVSASMRDVANLSAFSQTLPPVSWTGVDLARGGRLYDKFWKVKDVTATEPAATHPLYPSFGAKSGSDTWRCKECHGWDYIGPNGRYAGGSHYTGVRGLYPATLTKWQAYKAIKDGHGYGDAGLTDKDIWDLVAFYDGGMFDINFILKSSGAFIGDAAKGKALYDGGVGGGASCASCHGADGLTAVVAGFTAFVGFLSNDNPQEFQHKARFGHPGSNMVVTHDGGATLKDIADISLYSQSLPVAPTP